MSGCRRAIHLKVNTEAPTNLIKPSIPKLWALFSHLSLLLPPDLTWHKSFWVLVRCVQFNPTRVDVLAAFRLDNARAVSLQVLLWSTQLSVVILFGLIHANVTVDVY